MSLTALHEPYYSAILGDTPASNLIEQPRNIGTAPAILYSVLKIAAVDPQAVVALFPSDHYVSDNTKFMTHIRSAFETAHFGQDLVILLGVEPESPETEYGWIEPAAIDSRTQTIPLRSAFLGKARFRSGGRSAVTRLSVEQFCHGRVRPRVNRYYRERHTSAL